MQPRHDEQVQLLQAKSMLGKLPSEDVPELCTDLLIAGYDTPTLRTLAGLPPAELDEVQDLLPRLFHEFVIQTLRGFIKNASRENEDRLEQFLNPAGLLGGKTAKRDVKMYVRQRGTL